VAAKATPKSATSATGGLSDRHPDAVYAGIADVKSFALPRIDRIVGAL
jgi:hypothetical protein